MTSFTEKASIKYGGGNIHAEAEVFIFIDENEGGRGLSWHGVVQRASIQDKFILVDVRLDQAPERYFGNSDLKKVPRGTKDSTPSSGLAAKLYYHAHNKIAALTDDEAVFLGSYFRPLKDSDQASTVQSELAKFPRHNQLSGIEDDFEKAELSEISPRTSKLIDDDLPKFAIEGMTAGQWAKFKRRAKWLADTFIRQRQKAGKLSCDDCEFDPASRSDLQGIVPRSLLDVHHKAPLEEGVRHTTTADFALLCPTCHRITHARLRLNAARP